MRHQMHADVEYSPKERFWLFALAGFGLVALNGVFIYGISRPNVLEEALGNPLTLVFAGEAFLVLGLLSYLLTKWQVARLSWRWFVFLSLLGSMAFALPVVLLWPRSRTGGPLPPGAGG